MNRLIAPALLALSGISTVHAVDVVVFDNIPAAMDIFVDMKDGATYADDVTLGGTDRTVTRVDLPVFYDSPTGAVCTVDVTLSLYDVAVPSGLPGNVLFTQTKPNVVFTSLPNPGVILSYTGLSVTVPTTLRWGVQFSNLRGVSEFESLGVVLGTTTPTPAGAANFEGPNGIYIRSVGSPNFLAADIIDEPDVFGLRVLSSSASSGAGTLKILGRATGQPVESYLFEHTGNVGQSYFLQVNPVISNAAGWSNVLTFPQTNAVSTFIAPASGLRQYFRSQLAPPVPP